MLHFVVRVVIGCCLLVGALPGLAAALPTIEGLASPPAEAYDLTWQLHGASRSPVCIDIEIARGRGYRICLTARDACWQQLTPRPQDRVRVSLTLDHDQTYTFSLKRRAGTVALLCDHRLLLTAPLPDAPRGQLAVTAVPADAILTEVRYQPIDTPRFGDDFMRPEALEERLLHAQDPWWEDAAWPVAFYHRPDPAENPHDPQTGAPLCNPWQLNIFPHARTTTNGFTLLYTGVGPSWVVASPQLASPTWDRYGVQVAVRPDYDSVVGVLAAYQDAGNYLLFRWRPRTAQAPVRAELMTLRDGVATVLAQRDEGFVPTQWYTLRLVVSWQRVQVWIDDRLLCDVPNPGPVEGRIGLYAEGAAHPTRPTLDPTTVAMYATPDPRTRELDPTLDLNALQAGYTLFDDVQVTPWEPIESLATSPYTFTRTGRWQVDTETLTATTSGRWITALPDAEHYVLHGKVLLSPQGEAGLFLQGSTDGTGLAWMLSTGGQRLCRLTRGKVSAPVATTATAVPSGRWVTVRVVVNGPAITCWCDEQRVLDYYGASPAQQTGFAGVLAVTAGVQWSQVHVTPLPPSPMSPPLPDGFTGDRWLCTWASAEAEWTPAFVAPDVTPMGDAHMLAGAAAPYPTDAPGLYWYKGGLYGDVSITVPLSRMLAVGPEIILTPSSEETAGYRWQLTRQGKNGRVQCWRQSQLLDTSTFPVTPTTRLCLLRQGPLLILRVQVIDSEDRSTDPVCLEDRCLAVYRDPQPLPACHLGVRVTDPALPAAQVQVISDRSSATFTQAPVAWLTQSGIWQVMARYACDPQWNWFGGYGAGTPAVWSKARLDGDQTVEVYLGVKMQYLDMPGEEAQRFRDLDMSICADGHTPHSGYSLIRATRTPDGPITHLLRNGVVVWESRDPRDLLPVGLQGHRQWFATRLEKAGATIRVYLDNRLATTYTDPDPLPGGYVAVWTRDNGLLLGRANLAAEQLIWTAPPPVIEQ